MMYLNFECSNKYIQDRNVYSIINNLLIRIYICITYSTSKLSKFSRRFPAKYFRVKHYYIFNSIMVHRTMPKIMYNTNIWFVREMKNPSGDGNGLVILSLCRFWKLVELFEIKCNDNRAKLFVKKKKWHVRILTKTFVFFHNSFI